ncbi:MAG: nitrilase [Tetrasphaera jenkinsii]|jgi:predicted amidohydrolase|nr:nitrilase [Tetrasphaera jenkinsii]
MADGAGNAITGSESGASAGGGDVRRSPRSNLLITPELALTGYDIGDLGDDLTSPALVAEAAAVAKEVGIGLIVGVAQREEPGGVTWNAAVAIDRAGMVCATYRKIHLFGGLDRSRFAPGPTPPTVVDIDGLRVGMLICYDIEFPEGARALALAGADLIGIPTANMTPWLAVNEHIVPTRAVENQVYVAYANHIGREGDTHYLGASVIAGPDGSTHRANATDEAIVVTTIDLDDLARRRVESPYLADRRPQLYHSLVADSAVPEEDS